MHIQNTFTEKFTGVLLIIIKSGKQLSCYSISEWINCKFHIIQYNSMIKRNDQAMHTHG